MSSIFKRTTALIFVLGLFLTLLSACNAAPQQSPSPEPSAAESSAPVEETASPEPSEEISPSPEATETGIARGTWTDGVYTHDYAQLTFTLPEGWIAATDEDIASLMGQSVEILGDKQQWMIESAKLTTIYDMMAQDPATGNNALVMFENLSLSPGGLDISEEDYLEIAEGQMSQMESMDYTFSEPYNATVNGVKYLIVRADEANNNFSQYYLMHKQDKYMVGIIISIFDGTDIDDILPLFE